MLAKDAIEKVLVQTTSFFEKATEMRFFVHLLCLVLYLELVLSASTKKTLLAITWSELEHVPPGGIILAVAGYFFLMGYLFRLLYALVSWFVFRVHSRFASFDSWSKIPGNVCASDVLRKAHESKDYEPVRMLEVHRESCRQDRQEMADLSYISFCALLFGYMNHLFVHDSFIDQGIALLASVVGNDFTELACILLVLPSFVPMAISMTDAYMRDRYVAHEPLYEEIEEEKRIEREKDRAAMPPMVRPFPHAD